MARFNEVEKNIQKKSGFNMAVKGLAIMVVGAAAISMGNAHFDKKAQSVSDCVQLAIGNAQESIYQLSEHGPDVFGQTLNKSISPLVKDDLGYSYGIKNKTHRGFNPNTIESASQNEDGSINITTPTAESRGIYKSACENPSFQAEMKNTSNTIKSVKTAMAEGSSNEAIDLQYPEDSNLATINIDRKHIRDSQSRKEDVSIKVKNTL